MKSNSEFLKILLATFISQSGSHFLTLAIATHTYVTTGSLVSSALVFVVSYLPSIFFSSSLGLLIDNYLNRSFLIKNELLSILLTLLCGLAIYYKLPLSILCLILSIRSILSFVCRSSSSKWIKCISSPNEQALRFKLFSFAFFLSTAVSGILASVLLTQVSILYVIGIDALSYLLGIGVFASLIPLAQEKAVEVKSVAINAEIIPSTYFSIFQTKSLRMNFIFVCFSQALFQGAYSVLISYLPLSLFKLGMRGVGIFQLAASMGIILGFLILWALPEILKSPQSKYFFKIIGANIVAIGVLFLCLSSENLTRSVSLFFCLNILYELIWLHSSAEFFRASPLQATARFNFTLNSTAALSMALSTMSFAFCIQNFTIVTAFACTLLQNLIFMWLLFCLAKLRFSDPLQLARTHK